MTRKNIQTVIILVALTILIHQLTFETKASRRARWIGHYLHNNTLSNSVVRTQERPSTTADIQQNASSPVKPTNQSFSTFGSSSVKRINQAFGSANVSSTTKPTSLQGTNNQSNLTKHNWLRSNRSNTLRETEQLLAFIRPSDNKTVYDVLPSLNRTLTMIVYTSGEMCNHLSVFAHARVAQRYVEKQIPGVKVKLVGEHQHNSKWVRGYNDIVNCFPNFRNFSFHSGVFDPSFAPIQTQQEKWLGLKVSLLNNIASQDQIDYLRHILLQQQQQRTDSGIPPPLDHLGSGPKHNYSLPYLSVKGFEDFELVNDVETYEDIRAFLRFDKERCCNQRPEPDETVFHFRNFVTELKKESLRERLDFVELTPNETVAALFEGNEVALQHPKKVAIITRFAETAQPFAAAFEARGWNARLVEGQTGVQDFCFAMEASSLVGLNKSTYTKWSGILGSSSVVRWYHVNISRTTSDPVEKSMRTIQGRDFWSEVYGRNDKLTEAMLRSTQ